MTIDEAIVHKREIAKQNRTLLNSDELVQKSYNAYFDKLKYEKCAEEHEQLAEWLEELKVYRKCNAFTEVRNKTIDECIAIVKANYRMEALEQLEQLKAGKNNENYNKEES